ncbi:S-layer glycoprotein N-glycosyltransferase AglJ [Halanaeroarchaeum sulfurireducens]|uniref:Glycosyl transferase family 2 n=1 Tax=Halanaeroarchaeum sulfurireducens TaxID=1604004 RepID=A0A0F7PA46_9EURY|nr:S-layer glycoprotein N-glycosyltransferase AglJ [Halanaeroarchaeum sulfurireducens]AKH98021.1 glycosyl transferase family 2 [Halanaeroarchaeum sulfurireducens]
MPDYEDVCVLIPTLDEAATIGDVVDGLEAEGLENVLVVDGHSTDGTQDVAADHGARVIEQSGEGKGQAVREALEYVDAPFVLMLDGDGTYRPDEAHRLLEPLLDGQAEHVIGDRFANMEPGAMTRFNKIGNRLFNGIFRRIHGEDFADILSGYRAFTLESVEKLYLGAEGFGIETEMAVECAKHDVPTAVVPITYGARPEGSDTNLRPIADGGRILYTLYSLAKTSNPLFYYGSVGAVSLFVGLLLGAYVGYEWFVSGVSHEVIAVLATLALLFGGMLVLFGFLSDLMVTLHREQLRRIDRLDEKR